jgi:predicted RNase H-like HicB family nuclease
MPADWKMDDEMRAWERLVPIGLEYAGEVTEEDGGFVARCLNPEVASDGATPEEALANLREALELYFDEPTAPLVDRTFTSE